MTLNFATCSVLDVLEEALARFPGSFPLMLRDASKQHSMALYESEEKDMYVRRAMTKLAADCAHAAQLIDEAYLETSMGEDPHALGRIMERIGLYVPAFDAACKLLDIPREARREIAARQTVSDMLA